jgi:hypothetical protein
MLAMHKDIVKLFDKVASQMKSVRSATLELYKASLKVYCPNYAKANKTDESFQRAIVEMEKDIVSQLVKRECDVKTVKRYLSGCYQQVICGNTEFNLNLLSTKRKTRIAALVQGGTSFSDAFQDSREVGEKEDIDISTHLVLRPADKSEDVSDYLDHINERVKDFLAGQGIPVFSGFQAVKKRQRQVV